MDCFYMPIEMVFVAKSHDTKSALEAFFVGVGDQMSSEMGISFEGFAAIGFSADKRAIVRVFLVDVSEKMCILVETFAARWTSVVSRSRLRYFRGRSLQKD